MSEIHACFALAGLEKLSYNQRDRLEIVDMYKDHLGDRVGFQSVRDGDVSTYQVFSIALKDEDKKSKARVMGAMKDRFNVECRDYYNPPLHKTEAFRQEVDLPVTDLVCEKIITLPLHLWMNKEEVRHVCDSLEASLDCFSGSLEN
jgi:dTDP-4-amino-4,6-dideoxygalactose transaminase